MELGADLCVLIYNIAFVKYDVAEAELDGEACRNFCSALAAVRFDFLFFGVLGVVEAILLGKEIQNVAKVEALAMLFDSNVKRLHVDVADVERSREEL